MGKVDRVMPFKQDLTVKKQIKKNKFSKPSRVRC